MCDFRLVFRIGFEHFSPLPEDGAIAQLGERDNGIVEVRGSIPLGSTKNHKTKPSDKTAAFVFAQFGQFLPAVSYASGHRMVRLIDGHGSVIAGKD